MTKCAELANLIGNINAGGGGVGRNLIINGAMNVSQRGTSFADVSNDTYTLDRFNRRESNDGAVTITQDSSAPSGFANSLKVDVTTADSSIGSSQFEAIEHIIEAQNLQTLAFGTSDAKNFTVSFYVKSNKTGTYALNVIQEDNSSKQATLNYTIDSANTWERKSLTFTGDTSGVINDDNGGGFKILIWLAAGSDFTSGSATATFQSYSNAQAAAQHGVNLLDSTSNEWFITGLQLEVGQNPTSFEHEPFERTFLKCQRYFQKSYPHGNFLGDNTGNGAVGYYATSDADRQNITWALPMRAAPDMSIQRKNGGGANQAQRGNNAGTYADLSSITAVSTGLEFLQDATNDAHFRFHYYADAEL